jgi:integrase
MDLCNRFLTAKIHQRNAGDITPRTFTDYKATSDRLIEVFGKVRRVDDLAASDFEKLRASIAKTRGVVALGNEVQRIRVVFKYAYDAGLVDKPVRYGPTFKRPSRKTLRLDRHKKQQQNGMKMFDATDLRRIIEAAEAPLKAMILLGVNCGFGNSDCGQLPIQGLDLDAGWIDYPRPKTGIHRRCPLWPETVAALRESLAARPEPANSTDAQLVFITKYGSTWAKETADNPISKEMRKLLKGIDKGAEDATEAGAAAMPKIHRHGVSFYALRHTFEAVGGETRDQVAVDQIMGHARDDMASHYRERIIDARLTAVTNHVHQWLFGAI